MAVRPVVKLGWSIFFVLALASSGLSYYSYNKQDELLKKHEDNLKNIKGLREKQAQLAAYQPKTQEEIELAKILADQQGDLWFLEDIEDLLGEKYFPTFILIGPLTQEVKENHIVYSRQMSLNASFTEMELLLSELETKRGFAISSLRIDSTKDNKTQGNDIDAAQRQKINFKLSCVKIKESFLAELGLPSTHTDQQNNPQVISLLLGVPWGEGQKLDLDNEVKDPFVVYVRQIPKLTKAEPLFTDSQDITAQYTLQGIGKIGGKKMVIISPDKVLEIGDMLDQKKIVKIEDEKVVLKQGRQEYYIKLPGTQEVGAQDKDSKDSNLKNKTENTSENELKEKKPAKPAESDEPVEVPQNESKNPIEDENNKKDMPNPQDTNPN